ncbi:cyclin homologue [Saimiriine gammaherpesvirus 2]|uniref:Cyclin homolog n=2 Tax=Saimiriine herpesvirus 2 (strain 11) TaxID=10383 RepID=CGH2_SHV21|nr:cyclin homologue [Saimiriine gammaherpesvirus 2]Q01043.1 RecName: Full=Cyclin homolog; AltName: Full=V-cyclin [Herpesvirus saimiri (strain 11)]pir/COBEQ2/ cyclin homolog ECLF2 - saimiriine herpesvirus 1 (strain 11) [Saimiriine alphaherpesvirus 1]1JOW_A Chain A, CYCLIN HOMOLOG [Saimiriine gammaherpesvirus 2]1XO2_A Chain A, Cyclin [Saimiriine gammaherpesvirus 2]2EUF_A Chain A, viral Cyclin [Herpesvirus saimiri (strain 11)]2F2C_A Chain A, Cyclin homolog [Herpesvirus saimiri (strain 11)]4TTH_
MADSPNRLNRAKIDSTTMKDPRVLNNLKLRELLLPKFTSLWEIQTEVTVDNRTILLTWMHLLCESFELDKSVFPLSVSILDRYLCKKQGTKKTLQKIGAACVLIGSKIRTVKPMTVSKLTYLSCDCFTNLELINQEKDILEALKWDTEAVLATDFLIPLCNALKIPEDLWPQLYEAASTTICKALIQPNIALLSPGLICAGGLLTTIETDNTNCRPWTCYLEDLSSILNFSTNTVRTVKDQVSEAFSLYDLEIL